MKPKMRRRPLTFWLLLFLLFFQGLSATPNGLMLVLDPTGGLMQMPLAMLADSPFTNYLIPGLILYVLLGLGAFFVVAYLLIRPNWAWPNGSIRSATNIGHGPPRPPSAWR